VEHWAHAMHVLIIFYHSLTANQHKPTKMNNDHTIVNKNWMLCLMLSYPTKT